MLGFSENDSLLYFSENLQGCTLFDQSGLIYCGRLGGGGELEIKQSSASARASDCLAEIMR